MQIFNTFESLKISKCCIPPTNTILHLKTTESHNISSIGMLATHKNVTPPTKSTVNCSLTKTYTTFAGYWSSDKPSFFCTTKECPTTLATKPFMSVSTELQSSAPRPAKADDNDLNKTWSFNSPAKDFSHVLSAQLLTRTESPVPPQRFCTYSRCFQWSLNIATQKFGESVCPSAWLWRQLLYFQRQSPSTSSNAQVDISCESGNTERMQSKKKKAVTQPDAIMTCKQDWK